ncbi:MAG: tRNA (adenosine(37)-N6)-threonylcarbamoyltransferase complex dimerization subunit type 1 TsaB [Henriciella sp.]|uniref:tRNA (adenosine(37)-N6)-threonylcarbamoyltransferase complex dimerization subunit type 1 TsaB n=1 Tax=Henriciella sp. TaxID=1968823 RepID=UPI003C76E5E7
MLTLGINTSGPACDVALVRDGACVASVYQAMTKGQDARLPGLISDCLAEAGVTFGDLSRLSVVTGPGSFTGVRVGIAFARGLALALKIPCIGITSLEAALPAGQQGSAIVLLPAKRRPPDITYWAQRFRTGEALDQPEEIGLSSVARELAAHPHFVYGDGLAALAETATSLDIHPAHPSAQRAAQIGETHDAETASSSPVYVRSPDAALPGGKRL